MIRDQRSLRTCRFDGFALILSALAVGAPVAPAVAQNPPPATFVTASLVRNITGPSFVTAPVVLTGDFNNDAIPDLVTGHTGGNSGDSDGVSLFLGNGDGTFQTLRDFPTPFLQPRAGVVADFDGDGNLDVAVVETGNPGNVVNVLLGDGTGGFRVLGPGPSFGGSNGDWGIAAGDVNGDGLVDVVVTARDDGTVVVLLGNGDGSFQAPTAYNTRCDGRGNPVGPPALGDFNGDGQPDVVVALSHPETQQRGISVLLNNGRGFQPPACYGVGPSVGNGFSPKATAVADFNRDGRLDVVLVSWDGASIFLGRGDGTFAANPGVTQGAPFGVAVTVGDVNNDGQPDVVVRDFRDSCVWVLIGNGNGTLQPAAGYVTDTGGFGPMSIVLADFNGDGNLDFVAGNGEDQLVTVGLGNGDGSFRAVRLFGYGPTAQGIAVADFAGNGRLSVVVGEGPSGDRGVAVLPGNGDGTLGSPVTIDFGVQNYAWDVVTGDVSGDGRPDIVAAPNNAFAHFNQIAVVIGNGDGTFQSPAYYATGRSGFTQTNVVKLADMDRNGSLDIVASNSDGSISVLLNQGQGTFGAAIVTLNVSTGAANMAIGDFNGDGKLDVALATGTNVTLLLGNGDGTFQAARTIPTPARANATLIAGDFNQDGKLDLAVTTNDSAPDTRNAGGGYFILLGGGDGTFTSGGPVTYFAHHEAPAIGPYWMSVADVNLDGNPDLLIGLRYTKISNPPGAGSFEEYLGFIVALGNGDGTFALNPVDPVVVGHFTQGIAVGDFNGDGAPDVALVSLNSIDGGSYVMVALNSTQPGGAEASGRQP